VWWVALAALLVASATWAAGAVSARQHREAADARLAAGLRAAGMELADVLAAAEARAEELARSPAVQRALAERDRAAARRIASAEDVALLAGDEPLAGGREWPVRRQVTVVARDGRVLGSVVAGAQVDRGLVARLATRSGLQSGDVLTVADGSRVTASTGGLSEGTQLPARGSGDADVDGAGYRYASAPLVAGTDLRLVALAPTDPIDEAAGEARRRAFIAALATVILLAFAAWTLTRLLRDRAPATVPSGSRADQRRRARDTRRDRDSSRRVRDAVALVGDALAATHDPEALLPVILESAIEATGAVGARLVSGGTEVARAGGQPLALSLGSDDDGVGRLLLYPAAGAVFDEGAEELVQWLAAQASIAIENERLHRTVKRQAITDELTQLANRRRFTETLGLEVRRAERFGDPLALVLADLDDFKLINDRYGHQAGDEVLRRFADVLRANLRDFDLPVRFGGEEFAVLLPETTLAGGEQLALRLAEALAALRIPAIDGDRAPVTASFGVAAYPEARSPDELLSAADRALYRAKAAGKNRVASASAESGRRA
jgi:diguanylate cyclase (GGDEF)-like protein